MGIPRFASWISKKYPNAVLKDLPDASQVFGLYIDMNGIIHPCCHSEDDPSVANLPLEAKLDNICATVDGLVQALHPNSVLYLAMDGVAPRAKMVQQRSRRYMAAHAKYGGASASDFAPRTASFTELEQIDAEQELHKAKATIEFGICDGPSVDDDGMLMGTPVKSKESLDIGLGIDDDYQFDVVHYDPASFDSSCISPGTEFMVLCAERVRKFCEEKISNASSSCSSSSPTSDGDVDNSCWKNLTVILSDSNTAGEGEHKIIDFIRSQEQMSHGHWKQQQGGGGGGGNAHVIVGLDADLILLCLSLHMDDVFVFRDNRRGETTSFAGTGSDVAGVCENDASKPEPPPTKQQQQQQLETPPSSGSAQFAADAQTEPEKEGTATATGTATECTEEEKEQEPKSAKQHHHHKKRRFYQPKYEMYSISTIGNGIVSEVRLLCEMLNLPSSVKLDSSESYKVVDDFIALATLMGNDFMPRLPSAYCGDLAMDNFLEVYIHDVLPHGTLTIEGGRINFETLKRFLRGYLQIETMWFRRFMASAGIVPEAATSCSQLLSETDSLYRKEYYSTTSCCGGGDGDGGAIDRACAKYVEGFEFVWKYYTTTSNEVAWDFAYPIHHAPLTADILRFLEQQGGDVTSRISAAAPSKPCDPFVQLLAILPPTSAALVPPSLRAVMIRPPKDLRQTFPTHWRVDYAGANGKEHLAAVMIPQANCETLAEHVALLSQSFTEDEKKRNSTTLSHIVLASRESAVATGLATRLHGTKPLNDDEHEGTNSKKASGILLLELNDPPCGIIDHQQPPHIRHYKRRNYNSKIPPLRLLTNIEANGGTGRHAQQRQRAAMKRHKKAITAQRDAGGSDAIDPSSAAILQPQLVLDKIGLGDFVLSVAGLVFVLSLVLAASVGGGDSGFLGFSAVLRLVFWLCSSLALLNIIGCSTPYDTTTQMRRNSIRDANCDWLCPKCFVLNFSRNSLCYLCEYPFADAVCKVVHSSRIPQSPPLMDPCHRPYVQEVSLGIPQKLVEAIGR